MSSSLYYETVNYQILSGYLFGPGTVLGVEEAQLPHRASSNEDILTGKQNIVNVTTGKAQDADFKLLVAYIPAILQKNAKQLHAVWYLILCYIRRNYSEKPAF